MSDPTSPGNSDSGNWYRSPSANDHASLGSTSSPQLEVAWPKAPRTCTLAPMYYSSKNTLPLISRGYTDEVSARISPIGASDFVKATITETSDPKSPVVNFSASLNLWDSCTLGWGSAVAECNAVLVKRGWDKDLCDHDYDWKDSAFLELTRSAIPDISHSRWGVLDQYGQLRLRPGSHPPDHSRGNDRRGSSVDRSRILVINGIWVGEQNRRRKFGTRLVENVRDQARMLTPEVQGTVSVFVRCGSFIERHYGELGYFHQTFIPQLALSRSVWPLEKNDVALITQLREACCHRPKYDPEGLERFWRSLGFKRVDNFSWMAWSQDPNHPLLKLEVPDTPDGGPCNLRPGQLSGEHGDLVNNERKFEGSHLQDLYDLLSGDQGTATDHLFRKWLTGPCLDSTDVFGNNALHFAALTFHSPAIRHILSEKPDLALLRNCERCTPLEAMLSKMEEIRLQPRMVSKFMGFGQNMIDAVGALSGKEVFDLTEMRIDEYDLLRGHDRISKLGENIGPERMVLFDSTVRIKYGCTCGQCVNGYLSPRMISRLVFAAAPAFWDDIWEAFPVERRSLSPSVWESEDPTDIDKRLTGVAIVAIWESIFASLGGDSDSDDLWRCIWPDSFRKGLRAMRIQVAPALIPPAGGILFPSVKNIRSTPRVRIVKERSKFEQLTARISGAIRRLFRYARNAEELYRVVTLHDRDERENDLFDPHQVKILQKLPMCRNDHEYDLVERMCFYPSRQPRNDSEAPGLSVVPAKRQRPNWEDDDLEALASGHY